MNKAVAAIAALNFAFHMATAKLYGFFIDEIYFLAFCSYLCMNSIEPLVWGGCALIVIRVIKRNEPRLWPWFGVLAGIGMLNKHTMLVFGFAIVAALLLTPDRKLMFNRYFLLAGAIAFAIFLPNLIWEIRNHFPHLEQLENIRRNGRDVQMNP